MNKLVQLINSKIITKDKSDENKEIELQRFLNSNFRKEKLSQKISFKSFSSSHQLSNFNLLAVSNFEGTEFVLKFNSQGSIIAQSQQYDKMGQKKQTPSIEQENKSEISLQIEQRFQELILQINCSLRDLYDQKKKVLQQPPFEINISFVLGILVVFGVGLCAFVILKGKDKESEKNQDSESFSFLFFCFLVVLILLGLANVAYAIIQPYEFFNFDYEVMNIVTRKLMNENQNFFRNKNYTLVCDIETTWIMLKPLNAVLNNEMSNQFHQQSQSDNF